MKARLISAPLFGLAIVCFFLPFVTASGCSGTLAYKGSETRTYTGKDLALGEDSDIGYRFVVLAAFFCAAGGLVLTVVRGWPAALIRASLATGGICCLVLLPMMLPLDSNLHVDELRAGWWGGLICFICAAALNLFLFAWTIRTWAPPRTYDPREAQKTR